MHVTLVDVNLILPQSLSNVYKMCTYVQEKNAFSYFYPKRKVLEDGVSTAPLDI